MPNRLTKITTRTGDDGTTSLGAGPKRISKTDLHIEALGTLDELNSNVGWVIAMGIPYPEIQTALSQIQQDLFDLGGELCPPHHRTITAGFVERLDKWIAQWNATLPPLQEFLLPGGTPTSAACHIARTICRRAERCLVRLHEQEKLNPESLRYINRLSDVLFIAARVIAREAHCEEVVWAHKRKK